MWNLKASSKIVQSRSQDKFYQIHRNKLKSMQPRMRIQEPSQPDFVYAKSKLNMSRRDRRIEIDRHNQILLMKIDSIKMADYNLNKLRPQAQNLTTLNSHTMNMMNQQIAEENKKICNKLLKVKSFYPTSNILDKTDHLEYVGSNISFNARRAMSVRSSQKQRPRSSYTTHFSSVQKNKNSASVKYISKFEPKQNQEELQVRPDTAPMFSRSQKAIRVPQSGRPRLENVNSQGEEAVQVL